jgi:hypothetical protein
VVQGVGPKYKPQYCKKKKKKKRLLKQTDRTRKEPLHVTLQLKRKEY